MAELAAASARRSRAMAMLALGYTPNEISFSRPDTRYLKLQPGAFDGSISMNRPPESKMVRRTRDTKACRIALRIPTAASSSGVAKFQKSPIASKPTPMTRGYERPQWNVGKLKFRRKATGFSRFVPLREPGRTAVEG